MRTLGRALLILIAFVPLLAGAAYFALRQSLPQTTGAVQLAGIEQPVEVLRDAYAVPHIFAGSIEDAVFALGYTHAQDRLWQMEMTRRIAAGRLAEVVGRSALDSDRFLRTLGLHRVAAATALQLDAETRRILDAYAAGVNAFIASRPVWPIEFWLTGVRPEPWEPADTIAAVKLMAWTLGGNWRNELLRMHLARTLPLARIQEILPPYPGDAPLPIVDLRELYRSIGEDAIRLAGLAPAAEGSASNSWAVSGERSASGKPLLANDPHLGLAAPPVWYLAHLSAPGLNVIGATLPGVPVVVLGRNERIAWGFTNTGPDVQDLYIERVTPSGEYLAPEGPRPFTVIEEVIKVRRGPDVTLRVRLSRHGPVLSEALHAPHSLAPRGHVLALQWTGLFEDDRSLQAGLRVARARNWQEFLAAASDHHSPQQNVLYADVEGNIGFVAAGRVPVRKAENDLKGLAPAPGWDARYDWIRFIPFAELPRAYNPEGGLLFSANEKIVPPDYPHFITSEWEPPYRARRIAELLGAAPRHSIATFARMQGDVLSPAMREILPRLIATRPRSERARRALELLAHWDSQMAMDRPEPLIAVAWWRQLTRALYADEMGDAFPSHWQPRAQFVANVLGAAEGQSAWCDNVRTPEVETCDELLAVSLEAALADLSARYGERIDKWRWGDAHAARSEHRPFGRIRLLDRWFSIRVPSPGGAYTLNRGLYRFAEEDEPYANRHAPSLRAIYDLADPEASLFIHSGGQSGNLLSPHYRAFAAAWSRGDYIPMVMDRSRIEMAGAERLVLRPAR
jgi:penicillin amidase